ncbi:MAG TPA: hypothetical protein VIW92_09565 [Thermoanaerobaculia bacterium]
MLTAAKPIAALPLPAQTPEAQKIAREIIVGILARAKTMYEVQLCAFVFLSNNFHPLVGYRRRPATRQVHALFDSNLAKEVNRLTQGSGPVFERRYTAILVSDEEEAQVRRFRYGLAQGVKEGLVEKPQDWPGAAAERKATGREILGAEAVTSVDHQHRPEKLDRSPAPRFHAYTREAWFMLWEAYSFFVAAFRTAAAKLKAGDRAAPFPTGSFPPALPYVTA